MPQSGSQANTTASRGRYGQYYRNRAIPVNPNTPAQSANRNLFGAAASAWKGLSSTQRSAWNVFAATMPRVDRLGTTIYWSGMQTFVECYMIKLGIGEAFADLPPAEIEFPPLEFSLVPDLSAGMSAAYVPEAVIDGFVLQIDTTTNYSSGVSFAGPSEFRRTANLVASTDSPTLIATQYNAVWHTLGSVGRVIFGRARLISLTGCAGPWVMTRNAVVA